MNKNMHALLSILDLHTELVGSRELSRQLKVRGIDLTERTVRHYLQMLDREGYTDVFGKSGRKITVAGRTELRRALISEKVGFVISRIETLSYLTTLQPRSLDGNVILNVFCFPRRQLREVVRLLRPLFRSPYVMSDRILVARCGQRIGTAVVPKGRMALGTVCSVTMNGLFLKAGIPVTSKYGGVLEIERGVAKRFLALISYAGSSHDPLEVFIKSGMTDAYGAVDTGSGSVLASYREIPTVCVNQARELSRMLEAKGIGGISAFGEPNRPLFGIQPDIDKAGMVIVGGLNPPALLEERGIEIDSMAMTALYEYTRLSPFESVFRRASP